MRKKLIAETDCPGCGNRFTPWRLGGPVKYCSRRCYVVAVRAASPIAERVCETCGQRFVPATCRNRSESLTRRFCGTACANEGNRKAPVERECVVCGTRFLAGPDGSGHRSMRTEHCSSRCGRFGRQLPHAESLTLLPLDVAYLAGLTDGEGCIGIHAHLKAVSLHVRFCVTNTNREALDWCRAVTGVGATVTRLSDNPRWKTSYSWVVSCGCAATVLTQLVPYLKIKAPQAALAIAFQERLRTPALRADLAWQLDWKAKMHEMNARGGKPPAPTPEAPFHA